MGLGNRIKFLEDKWVGEAPLNERFERLYSISNDKDKQIQQIGEWNTIGWEWRVEWRMERFEWEKGTS